MLASETGHRYVSFRDVVTIIKPDVLHGIVGIVVHPVTVPPALVERSVAGVDVALSEEPGNFGVP